MALDNMVFEDAFLYQGSAAPSLSVGEAVSKLSRLVEGQLAGLWIQGEVSNYSLSQAGHEYFTLKDDKAQIQCVRFSFERQHDDRPLSQGMRIEVWGHASVYLKGGTLQLRFERWRPAGLGALYAAYLERKRRLAEEGLFSRDKPRLPRFIRRVAVVSSPHAAGLQDVIATLRRRYPWIVGQLFAAKVQGDEAPQDLIRALDRATQWTPDVILIVRGGGSFEDLLAFSDETLTRAVAACPIPIVAGIGHETDESLVGLAASLCASTPTAAAELLGPDAASWHQRLDQAEFSLTNSVRQTLQQADRHYASYAKFWGDPQFMISQFVSQVTWQAEKLVGLMDKAVSSRELVLLPRQEVLKAVPRVVQTLSMTIVSSLERLARGMDEKRYQCEKALQALTHHAAWQYQTRWQSVSWQLDQWERQLNQGWHYQCQTRESSINQMDKRMLTPTFTEPRLVVERLHQAWERAWSHYMSQECLQVERLAERLALSNPMHWQAQGWAPVKFEDGRPVVNARDVTLHDRLTIQYLDGTLHVEVSEKPST